MTRMKLHWELQSLNGAASSSGAALAATASMGNDEMMDDAIPSELVPAGHVPAGHVPAGHALGVQVPAGQVAATAGTGMVARLTMPAGHLTMPAEQVAVPAGQVAMPAGHAAAAAAAISQGLALTAGSFDGFSTAPAGQAAVPAGQTAVPAGAFEGFSAPSFGAGFVELSQPGSSFAPPGAQQPQPPDLQAAGVSERGTSYGEATHLPLLAAQHAAVSERGASYGDAAPHFSHPPAAAPSAHGPPSLTDRQIDSLAYVSGPPLQPHVAASEPAAFPPATATAAAPSATISFPFQGQSLVQDSQQQQQQLQMHLQQQLQHLAQQQQQQQPTLEEQPTLEQQQQPTLEQHRLAQQQTTLDQHLSQLSSLGFPAGGSDLNGLPHQQQHQQSTGFAAMDDVSDRVPRQHLPPQQHMQPHQQPGSLPSAAYLELSAALQHTQQPQVQPQLGRSAPFPAATVASAALLAQQLQSAAFPAAGASGDGVVAASQHPQPTSPHIPPLEGATAGAADAPALLTPEQLQFALQQLPPEQQPTSQHSPPAGLGGAADASSMLRPEQLQFALQRLQQLPPLQPPASLAPAAATGDSVVVVPSQNLPPASQDPPPAGLASAGDTSSVLTSEQLHFALQQLQSQNLQLQNLPPTGFAGAADAPSALSPEQLQFALQQLQHLPQAAPTVGAADVSSALSPEQLQFALQQLQPLQQLPPAGFSAAVIAAAAGLDLSGALPPINPLAAALLQQAGNVTGPAGSVPGPDGSLTGEAPMPVPIQAVPIQSVPAQAAAMDAASREEEPFPSESAAHAHQASGSPPGPLITSDVAFNVASDVA